MPITVECKQCHKDFDVSPSRLGIRKFCSAECKIEYNNSLKSVINCKYCGKEFKIYNHIKHRKHYCSKECQNKSQEKNVEYICEFCGKQFTRQPSRLQGLHIYCSNECKSNSLVKKETRKCCICNKDVTRAASSFKEHVICSNECRSEWSRRNATGEKSNIFNSVLMTCLVCGKQFYEPESRVLQGKGKFCCKPCKYEYFKTHFAETKNPNWKGGAKDYRGPNWNQQRKRALMRDEFTCQICGSSEKLIVHHLKRYAEFNGDWAKANQLDNLQTLCSSCHSHIENRQEIAKERIKLKLGQYRANLLDYERPKDSVERRE